MEGSPVSSSSPLITESEEEDCYNYTAGLAERIAHAMLEEDEEDLKIDYLPILRNDNCVCQVPLHFSPHSSPAGHRCLCCEMKRSNKNGCCSASTSGITSPLSPLALKCQAKEDLLYAERLRQRMGEERRALDTAEQITLQQYVLSPYKVVATSSSSNLASVYPRQPRAGLNKDISSGSFSAKVGRNPKSGNEPCVGVNGKHVNPVWTTRCAKSRDDVWSHPPSMPGLVHGSGMRAVFLESPHGESPGTGVFLPRIAGSMPDARKIPACSPVLLPSRIVKALNFKVEDTVSCPVSSLASMVARSKNGNWSRRSQGGRNECLTRFTGSMLPQGASDSSPSTSRSLELSQSEWPPLRPQLQLQEVAPDISLPVEWTY